LVAHPHFGHRYGCGGIEYFELLFLIYFQEINYTFVFAFCFVFLVCVCDFYFVYFILLLISFAFHFLNPKACAHMDEPLEVKLVQNYLATWDFTNLLSLEYGQVRSKNSQTKPSRKISLSRNSPNSNTPAKSPAKNKCSPVKKVLQLGVKIKTEQSSVKRYHTWKDSYLVQYKWLSKVG